MKGEGEMERVRDGRRIGDDDLIIFTLPAELTNDAASFPPLIFSRVYVC